MHEYDREVVVDILDNMIWALDQIQKRFREIETASDFLDSGSIGHSIAVVSHRLKI